MQLIIFFIKIVLIALVITFGMLVLTKSGIRDFLRDKFASHKDLEIVAEAIDCNFCFGFWLSFIIAISLFIITGNVHWIVSPIFVSPIIRFLL